MDIKKSRRVWLKQMAALGAGISIAPLTGFTNQSGNLLKSVPLRKSDFGNDFKWGTATSAYQIEGAWDADGKGPSIWDTFSQKPKNIKDGTNGNVSCDFYNRYPQDLRLLKELGFSVFRFSLSWSRLFPSGLGQPNQAGFDFYNRVIDTCLELGIQPWITLYHWDLPQALEDQGGWLNRDIVSWFSNYTTHCAKAFGDRVKHWMIINEPLAYTLAGYGGSYHAPGKRGFRKFLKAAHHTALCQAEGGRVLRKILPNADIGTTFSTSAIDPKKQGKGHAKTAALFDAMINRMFLEPALGMGYPTDDFPALRKIERYMLPGDEEKLAFDFDFHGLQNYTRLVTKRMGIIPWFHGLEWKAEKRVENESLITEMGWEVYPEGIYRQLKAFAAYEGIKRIIITENGAAFGDELEQDGLNDSVHDVKRVEFYKAYLVQVLRAIKEGVPVEGYYAWSFMDNFEWAEGYLPRFGLVYVNFETQKRVVKDSGLWFKDFLNR
jgi:beta-glucosidase